jgi:hypothetical protein
MLLILTRQRPYDARGLREEFSMKSIVLVSTLALVVTGCARAQVTRTSANTALIDAGAAPACGSTGAAKVAAKSAAVETIKAGYDRYIITGGQSQNNVSTIALPGQYNTMGSYSGGLSSGTTTYTPGPIITRGSHDRSLSVVMFKNGQPGAENALDARQMLGPEWKEIVANGVHTCL